MRGQERIDEMWAWVVVDDDGTEGVPAYIDPTTKTWAPMIGADADRVRSLRPFAKHVANIKQRSVELLRFTTRESMGTLRPSKPPKPSGRVTPPKKDRPLAPDPQETANWVVDEARGRDPGHPYVAFDQQQIGQSFMADQVIVAAALVDGQPAVSFVFVKDGKPLPGIGLVGDQINNIPELVRSAFEGAKRALN